MKKIIIFLIVFSLLTVNMFADSSSNVKTGGSIATNLNFANEAASVSVGFLPWFHFPIGDEHSLTISTPFWGSSDYILTSPGLTLSMLRNVFHLGTFATLGFDFYENEANFIARQGFFGEIGYEWKHFSFMIEGESEINYLNLSETLTVVSANTLFHIRDEDHTRPYPWTITLGPEFSWLYSSDEDENYYRDIITLELGFELESIAQGSEDYFPRSWSPRQKISFVNQFDRQEWLENSFDWVWEPSIRAELSISPLDDLSILAHANIPLTDAESISAGISARVRLY